MLPVPLKRRSVRVLSDDCGSTCSTAPCDSVEAAANSFPKKGISGEVKFAKALDYGHQKAVPVNMTPKGARTQKATMLEK